MIKMVSFIQEEEELDLRALVWRDVRDIMKEETEQAPSWKQDSILGQTVDFELYAQ